MPNAVIKDFKLNIATDLCYNVLVSHNAGSDTTPAVPCPSDCPFTPVSVTGSVPPAAIQTGWYPIDVNDNNDMSSFQSLYPPKRCVEEIGPDLHRTAKRATTIEALTQYHAYLPTIRSDKVEDTSGWNDPTTLTSAQYTTVPLNKVLNCQNSHGFDIDNLGMPAYSPIDPGKATEESSTSLWQPEATVDHALNECANHKGKVITGLLDCLVSTSATSHEGPHLEPATRALTHTKSVASILPEPQTVLTETNRTAPLLSRMFPPLPPHLDPLDSLSVKLPIQPNDLYNPLYVRNDGVKNREGWCGYCQRWLQLRESSYNYDKKYAHGICPNTGRPFDVPIEIKRSFGRRSGKSNKNVSHYEGRCGECGKWIRLVGRSGPANSWWRHAFQVPGFLYTLYFLLVHELC